MRDDNAPALWRARVASEDGATFRLVAARNEREVVDLLVEPDYEHLVVSIERLGPLPFGPGVIR